jgi:hypothetical protein
MKLSGDPGRVAAAATWVFASVTVVGLTERNDLYW